MRRTKSANSQQRAIFTFRFFPAKPFRVLDQKGMVFLEKFHIFWKIFFKKLFYVFIFISIYQAEPAENPFCVRIDYKFRLSACIQKDRVSCLRPYAFEV